MNDVFKKIREIGVIPVITLDGAADAVPLAKALYDGGINCAEVTLRTGAALEGIRLIKEQMPVMLLMAGTVLSEEQAETALSAGAGVIIAPGLNPAVARYCVSRGVPYIPGVVTPTEIETAMSLGLNTVKFFPAAQAGGAAYIKAVSAPYPDMRFIPTGGISPANLAEFTALPNVIACGASFIADRELIKDKDYAEITRRCREARETAARRR